MHHKKIIKILTDHLRDRQTVINSDVHMRDLIAYHRSRQGEYKFPSNKNENESEIVQRMLRYVNELAESAAKIHLQDNFVSDASKDSLADAKMRPEKVNHVTRLTLDEFSLYPAKSAGPLTTEGFRQLMDGIKEIASKYPENLQLILSSVPVKMSVAEVSDEKESKEIAVLQSRVIVVDCGKKPVLHPFAKSYPSYQNPNFVSLADPVYPGVKNYFAIDIDKLSKDILEKFNELQTMAPTKLTEESVASYIDYYQSLNVNSAAMVYVIQILETIKIHVANGFTSSSKDQETLANHVNELKKFVGTVSADLKNKNAFPLFFPTLGDGSERKETDADRNVIFGGDMLCKTAGEAVYHLAVEPCLDNDQGLAKQNITRKMTSARDKAESLIPLHAAHIVTSDSIDLSEKNLISQTVAHADPIESKYVGKIKPDTTTVIENPAFGSTTIIDVYPSRKLSALHGELLTTAKAHNSFMLKLEAMHLYQNSQPSQIVLLEQMIQQHILEPVIQFLKEREVKTVGDEKFKTLLLSSVQNLESSVLNSDLKATMSFLNDLRVKLKDYPQMSQEKIQTGMKLLELEQIRLDKFWEQYPELMKQSRPRQLESKENFETAIIPYSPSRVEAIKALFFHAIEADDLPTLQKLFAEPQFDVNFRNTQGQTALHHAVSCGNIEMVKLLLNRGADPMIADAQGNTALHIAASNFSVKIFTAIMSENPDLNVNPVNQDGETPAIIAAKKGGFRFLSNLNKYQIDFNKTDSEGRAVLDYAFSSTDVELPAALLSRDESKNEELAQNIIEFLQSKSTVSEKGSLISKLKDPEYPLSVLFSSVENLSRLTKDLEGSSLSVSHKKS